MNLVINEATCSATGEPIGQCRCSGHGARTVRRSTRATLTGRAIAHRTRPRRMPGRSRLPSRPASCSSRTARADSMFTPTWMSCPIRSRTATRLRHRSRRRKWPRAGSLTTGATGDTLRKGGPGSEGRVPASRPPAWSVPSRPRRLSGTPELGAARLVVGTRSGRCGAVAGAGSGPSSRAGIAHHLKARSSAPMKPSFTDEI